MNATQPLRAAARYRSISAVALVLAWHGSLAHDFWIEPANFRPAADSELRVTLRVGEDFSGDSQPFDPNWFFDFALYAGDVRTPVRGIIGDDPAGNFAITTSGTQVVGYHSRPSYVAIDPSTFDDYLRAEGLEWVMDRRREQGQSESPAGELFSRCAKALVLPAGRLPGSGFDVELGYPLELIPERDPYSLAAGAELPVRLVYRGKPISNILVVAFTAEEPETKSLQRTGDDGRVRIPLTRPGTWLVKAVHIIELPEANRYAQWESFWASLTFSLLL
ncbi:MAG: DUF4198 domain-containing protein [Gammaproteobacteria bacterium]|nr:DUF4198 domain-containing protein [Gammaproteobacteria bacterium]